jgi:gas vesicle protein
MASEERNTVTEQDGGVEILLILAGVAIGALLGLLYAPRSGERTRRQLRRRYEDVRDRAADLGDDLVERVEDLRQSVTRRIETSQDYVGQKKDEVLASLAGLGENLDVLKKKLARR